MEVLRKDTVDDDCTRWRLCVLLCCSALDSGI